ncbi:MAG: hypothetical protein C0599_11330 [Salinivirgaceae bacterium]|nr:MAG: hypothetical protein C0599_11330 [Salinivirgaceae bacterium]
MKKKIAFIGAGHACLQMIKLYEFSNDFEVELICDKNYNAPAIEYARKNNIKTVREISDINNYEIDFLVELTGKNQLVMEAIREHIPKEVSVIDSHGADMFFSLFSIMWKDKSNETIEILDDATKKLHKYFKDFYEIQNTISLLSINASIEAKRAGEAGAGFSAIARAIKDLVNQSEQTSNDCFSELKNLEEIKSNMLKHDKNFLNSDN